MLIFSVRSEKQKAMFRKLVTNVPFSPALVGQLGFYARRLKKEETTRQLGLVFTALALVVQSFAVFIPPQSANAANDSDFIRGGISSKRDLLRAYDRSARGNGDIKDIFDYAGITRAELASMREGTLNSKGKGTGQNAWQTWGRVPRFSPAEGMVKHVVPRDGGGTSTVYSRPLWRYDSKPYTIKHGSSYPALFGHSKKLGQFAIMKDCGNLVTTETPKPAPKGAFLDATCRTITGYAYDARNRDRDVKIYLYYGGPPGKGDRSVGYMAKLDGNRFRIDVPQRYQKKDKPTQVWGALIPLAGWNDRSVQFANTARIPSNCIEEAKPVPMAACVDLDLRRISRTEVSLLGQAGAYGGAQLDNYQFTVKDSSGATVATKTIDSSRERIDSGTIQLDKDGDYTAYLKVATSQGLKSGDNCRQGFTVASPEMCALNPELPKDHPDCKPCPANPQLAFDSPDCQPETVTGKTAVNLTQSTDAEAVTAQASDRIEYTIYAENTGLVPASVTMEEQLNDVMEYASLYQTGGGKYDEESKVLSWGKVELDPGETQSRSFVVQLLDEIPATPQGQSEPGSYDCVITNSFGNTVTTEVNCQTVKVVEQTVKELPKTGPGANIFFGGSLAAVVTYFWSRSRQLGREIRLIRKDVNAGVI